MAFRDSWHRALVYFGLAEEYHDDYDDEPRGAGHEPDVEDRYRERPNVRRLRRRRDEFDDIFAEDEPRGRSATALRSVGAAAATATATCACIWSCRSRSTTLSR